MPTSKRPGQVRTGRKTVPQFENQIEDGPSGLSFMRRRTKLERLPATLADSLMAAIGRNGGNRPTHLKRSPFAEGSGERAG
jgi:hypothetical protein